MAERRVLLHCNAGAIFGMGHLMRCLALAQTALRRGWAVTLIGDIDSTALMIAQRTIPGTRIIPANETLEQDFQAVIAEGVDVVHFDTYWDVPKVGDPRILVSNMQDGAYGVRAAHLTIDANLGAERTIEHVDPSGSQLVGIDVAVIRDQVLRQRDVYPISGSRPRVLVVMGGTDPNDLTPRVIRALESIETALEVTVVGVSRAPALKAGSESSRHRVEIVGFVADLPALARHHDLVISAAGTSVWDFACMGLPMALVCAVDNQRGGYRAATAAGFAVGLGTPPHDDLEQRIVQLGPLLHDRAWLNRQRDLLLQAVDGKGAWRIVSAWEQLSGISTRVLPPSEFFAMRPATFGDAELLFEWRNDETTRSQSRNRGGIDWGTHLSWLRGVLDDPDRQLLVAESDDEPVATVRWDRASLTDWEVSITIAPHHRAKGLARAVLAAGERALVAEAPIRLMADIHIENEASRRLFIGAGYLAHLPPDAAGFERRAKWRLQSR